MSLSEIVEALAALPELTAESCAAILGGQFGAPQGEIRRAPGSGDIAGAELRGTGEGAFLVVELKAGDPAAAKAIGTLEGSSLVSPPIANPARPDARPPWDRKWSERRRVGDRLVSFSFEEQGGEERLVSFSVS